MRSKPTAELEKAAPQAGDKPLRADAQRNRDKLVEAAAAAFAEHGVDTSLEDIARRAGVGIGTLYRHFPTSEHLVEVVYRHEVEALCAAADELARQHAPDVALAEWMQRFVDYIAAKRGMANSLRILLTTNSDLFAEASGRIPLALRRLVDAAIADGSIRSDIRKLRRAACAVQHLRHAGRSGLARSIPPPRFAPHGWPALGLGQSHRKPIARADTLSAYAQPTDLEAAPAQSLSRRICL